MISRRFLDGIKRRDWFGIVTDFAIVVLGIFIGLQASLWVQTRQDVETERRYLERRRRHPRRFGRPGHI